MVGCGPDLAPAAVALRKAIALSRYVAIQSEVGCSTPCLCRCLCVCLSACIYLCVYVCVDEQVNAPTAPLFNFIQYCLDDGAPKEAVGAAAITRHVQRYIRHACIVPLAVYPCIYISPSSVLVVVRVWVKCLCLQNERYWMFLGTRVCICAMTRQFAQDGGLPPEMD